MLTLLRAGHIFRGKNLAQRDRSGRGGLTEDGDEKCILSRGWGSGQRRLRGLGGKRLQSKRGSLGLLGSEGYRYTGLIGKSRR